MDSMPIHNNVPGDKLSWTSQGLETAAGLTQKLEPLKPICAHLNAFHAYASDPGRHVETNHYCAHLNQDFRQCILYDNEGRLIGIEYMVTPKLFDTLPSEERKLWHTHVFEVKSGMLIMPKPTGMPQTAWDAAETKEMEEVVTLYGKIYHLWQTDRGDKLPMGLPMLMTSYTEAQQFPDMEQELEKRDNRFGSDFRHNAEIRKHIPVPDLHPEADWTWKSDELRQAGGQGPTGGPPGGSDQTHDILKDTNPDQM